MDCNFKIELLKKMLYKSIDKNGLTAQPTVTLSQKLDFYIVQQQRGLKIG